MQQQHPDSNPLHPVLDVDAMGYAYSDHPLFTNLSLAVQPGETMAITGPSGSGKSTLLDCLVGLKDPTEGEVTLEGTPLRGLSEKSRRALRRSSIGLIRQQADLLVELSVIENICIVPLFAGTPRREAFDQALGVMRDLDIVDCLDRSVSTLSGGEAQRVAVARALCRRRPALIVADEPTASLDRVNVTLVTDCLLKAAQEFGVAVIMATHDEVVAGRCQEIVSLRQMA